VQTQRISPRADTNANEPAEGWSNWSRKILLKVACPICKEELQCDPGMLTCTECSRAFPQLDGAFIDLLPGVTDSDEVAWQIRQRLCDRWYAELVLDPRRAAITLKTDYQPHASVLASMGGAILDVGGGNGIVRQYLADADSYVSLDPSICWLADTWAPLRAEFPCLGRPMPFVRGAGEFMPFRAQSFDGVLSFWSLNHVTRPAAVIHEMARVLRPGGHAVIVLEDMTPRWRDLLAAARRSPASCSSLVPLKIGHAALGRPWPLQDDHLRIEEQELASWLGPLFRVVERKWIGTFVRYVVQRY
jgi:SAM-dependent methyltransferase